MNEFFLSSNLLKNEFFLSFFSEFPKKIVFGNDVRKVRIKFHSSLSTGIYEIIFQNIGEHEPIFFKSKLTQKKFLEIKFLNF